MKKKTKCKFEKLIPVAVIIAVLIIWQTVCSLELVPGYMLPSPLDVIKAFISDFSLLMMHSRVTLVEAVLGLSIGVLLGFVSAAIMDAFPPVKSALYPILVLTQTIPPVAKLPSTVKSATFKTLNVMKTPMAIMDQISAKHIAPGNEDK